MRITRPFFVSLFFISFLIGGCPKEVPSPTAPKTDCNGIENGDAYLDDCDMCVGGDTEKEPCEADCNGDYGGTAYMDECGECVGGDTGKEPCPTSPIIDAGSPQPPAETDAGSPEPSIETDAGTSPPSTDADAGTSAPNDAQDAGTHAETTDCNGDVNGAATTDECDNCVGGNTGAVACEQDCAGEWGGTAIMDCNDECNGTASMDACGNCAGGTTGVVPCVVGCMDTDAANYDNTATAAGDCLYTVTFTVDMSCSGYESDDLTVHVHGFNTDDWSAGSVELFDDDGDDIWSGTTTAESADYEYRVFAGEWLTGLDGGANTVNPLGSEDLTALSDCAAETDGAWNRQISVGDAPVSVTHVFGRCDACPPRGCTESGANNFDPAAVLDDGSCTYDVSLSIGNITWPDSEFVFCTASDPASCVDGAPGDRIPGAVEVMMSSTADVSGFSFKLGDTELDSSDVPSGGLASAASFDALISNGGFISAQGVNSGDVIAAPSDDLLIEVPVRVLLQPNGDNVCIEFPTFNDAAGQPTLTVEQDCVAAPPAATISVGEISNNQVEIWLQSDVNLGGIQFTIDGATPVASGSGQGGLVEHLDANKYSTQVGANGVVIIVSFSSYLLPSSASLCASSNSDMAAHCVTDATQPAKLITIDLASIDADEICISDVVLSDGGGNRVISESTCKSVTQ